MRMRSMFLIPIFVGALTACSTTHEFRVAAVGDGSQQVSAAEAATAGASSPLLVAAGNVLLGPATGLSASNAAAAPMGVVTGFVSGVVTDNGQTVVQLADGPLVLVNGVGAAAGDVVAIDIGQSEVIGGAQVLIGQGVTPDLVGETLASIPGGTSSTPGPTVLLGSGSGGGKGLLPTKPGQLLGPKPSTATVTQPLKPVVTGSLGLACC